MKRIFIAALLSVLAADLARAADLPPSPPPQAPAAYIPVAPPVYNWSGFYVGINGGWGFGTVKWTPSGFPANTVNPDGGVVGGTLGFNYQMNAFVFGAEGDFDYSAINSSAATALCNVNGNCQSGNTWLSTFRGRFGYAADRILFYGTAGGVFGNEKFTTNGATTTKTQAGWTAGVGIEAAFAQNWTAKVEYLYASLGSVNVTCVTAGGCGVGGVIPFGTPASVSLNDNLVRVGVNYKFNF
jgi:outer membrane immunogenic protein